MGLGSGGGGGLAGVAGAVLAAEICAPLLLLCGLCCWPDDSHSDTSSSTGKHPQKPVVAHDTGRRRSTDVFSRRHASSSASLHLPSTSGHSRQALAAHRSHEEIPTRRKSHLEVGEEDTRYHSAPSVIDEVIHRRDWERSSKELYIPLKPDSQLYDDADSDMSSPAAPKAEPESSSVECLRKEPTVTCKKHYTNIKTSRNKTKKESAQSDVKDLDATENPNNSEFYIGETLNEASVIKDFKDTSEKVKSVYKAKDDKQSFNESIKTKECPHFKCINDEEIHLPSFEGYEVQLLDVDLDLSLEQLVQLELDRSRALHHDASRGSLIPCVSRVAGPIPPSSVETVGWEGGACYLAEAGSLRSRTRLLASEGASTSGGVRARHASDGDILAPTLRPESGAFSESDLELELECCEERPPPYEDLQQRSPRKETAI